MGIVVQTGTPIENMLYEFTLVVDFSGGEPTFTLYHGSNVVDAIEVTSYTATLVFWLKVNGVSDPQNASFGSQFQWLSLKGQSADKPGTIAFLRASDINVTLIDSNTATTEEDSIVFRFLFTVVYNGRLYSSHDPVIINKKPPA